LVRSASQTMNMVTTAATKEKKRISQCVHFIARVQTQWEKD
jgi:hypothetical protein